MPTLTTTYDFQLPVVGADDDVWGDFLNANWTAIDLLFTNTFDNPVSGHLGRIKSANLPDPITEVLTISHASRPQLTIKRADDTVNAAIRYRGVTGSGIEAGLGDVGVFAVGPSGSLTSGDGLRDFWVDTATGNIGWTGAATGIGSGITALNADNLTTGTVPDARLPTTLAGKTFSTGIVLSGAASSTTDLGEGITLATNYGINKFSTFIDLVVPTGAGVKVYVNAVQKALIDTDGFSGAGSGITALNATQLTSGTVPSARMTGNYTALGSITADSISTTGTLSVSGIGTFQDDLRGANFYFTADTNTGLVNVSSNIAGLVAGGVEALRITSAIVQVRNGVVFSGSGSDITNLNASELSTGTVPNSVLPTGSTERSRILDLIAGASVGSVGTYAFLARQSSSRITKGDEIAGSALYYAGLQDSNLVYDTSNHPSGTWQAMGDSDVSGGSANATTFLRVS